MQQIYNKKFLFFVLFLMGFIWAGAVKAVCPACVIFVGAGLGLSRWLGVDDVVSSIWIGGGLWALSAWTIDWLKKKRWNFEYNEMVIPTVYYGFVFIPLYFYNIIGHPGNIILGADKIVFGMILGTIVFILSVRLHEYLKTKNKGKSFFPYQKVVVPLSALFIISLIFYLWI